MKPRCIDLRVSFRPARRVVAIALACMLPAGADAIAQQTVSKPSNEPSEFLTQPPKPATVRGNFRLVAIGDLLYSHPMANYADPKFQQVVDLIRSGDVTIGNQEGPILDLKAFRGTGYGHGLLLGEAALARDVKALGVDMVSVANNHSTDWGWEGLIETQRLLDQAGVVNSGGGRTLQAARAAGILSTPKGRVALVSTASTFKTNAGANDAFDDVPPRAGISTLRLQKVNLVSRTQFAAIRTLATELASGLEPAPAADATEIEFRDQLYRVSERRGLSYAMDLYDHAGLLKSVREAKAASDLAVFTIHAHESTTGTDDDTPPPPDFLIKLFHDCVDAGADVIIGGGPHSLRGVEIYKGKPIFYGMGVFFIKGDIKVMQETAMRVFPDSTGHAPPPAPPSQSVRAGGNPASWYDGMVAITEFENGKAVTVRLYPLDVGNTYDRSRRGNPHLAEPEVAQRILANLQRDSAPFGTVITIEGSVGVIHIP